MTLSSSSRYKRSTDNSGVSVTQRKVKESTRVLSVVTKEGQTMQTLAALHLGDPNLYWRIADLNPQIAFPDSIPMGTRLRVPKV